MITKKRVAALCKSRRRLAIRTMHDNTQWIGDGSAMYILAGIEPMSKESLASMLDYSEDDVRKIAFSESDVDEKLFGENNDAEVQIKSPPKRVMIMNAELLIFETGNQLIFIDGDYLKPIVTDDQTLYFMRTGADGNTALCVKKGLLPEAVIMGVEFEAETLKAWFEELNGIIAAVVTKYVRPTYARAEYEQMKLEDNEK